MNGRKSPSRRSTERSAAEGRTEQGTVESVQSDLAVRTPAGPIDLDTLLAAPSGLYEVLSNKKRRLVLEYLLENDGTAPLEDLATAVTAGLHETLPGAVLPGHRNEIRSRLVHIHLPKLDEFGLVVWDEDADEVRLNRDNGLVQIVERDPDPRAGTETGGE